VVRNARKIYDTLGYTMRQENLIRDNPRKKKEKIIKINRSSCDQISQIARREKYEQQKINPIQKKIVLFLARTMFNLILERRTSKLSMQ